MLGARVGVDGAWGSVWLMGGWVWLFPLGPRGEVVDGTGVEGGGRPVGGVGWACLG